MQKPDKEFYKKRYSEGYLFYMPPAGDTGGASGTDYYYTDPTLETDFNTLSCSQIQSLTSYIDGKFAVGGLTSVQYGYYQNKRVQLQIVYNSKCTGTTTSSDTGTGGGGSSTGIIPPTTTLDSALEVDFTTLTCSQLSSLINYINDKIAAGVSSTRLEYYNQKKYLIQAQITSKCGNPVPTESGSGTTNIFASTPVFTSGIVPTLSLTPAPTSGGGKGGAGGGGGGGGSSTPVAQKKRNNLWLIVSIILSGIVVYYNNKPEVK